MRTGQIVASCILSGIIGAVLALSFGWLLDLIVERDGLKRENDQLKRGGR